MRFLSLFIALVLALPLMAHEHWIEPERFEVELGDKINASLKNGENFFGAKFPYFSNRFERFEYFVDGTRNTVEGRDGDFPAVQLNAADPGLYVLAYQSTPATLTYAEWEKFQKFADHKAFQDIAERHDARGLPRADFIESYTRFSKSLVMVGTQSGDFHDVETGFETEIIALLNPYTDDLSRGLPVRVVYRGEIRANAQVEVFEKSPDGVVTVSTHQTDDTGVAIIPVQAGQRYLLDAVVLREAGSDPAQPVWETLWASLTFAVPQ